MQPMIYNVSINEKTPKKSIILRLQVKNRILFIIMRFFWWIYVGKFRPGILIMICTKSYLEMRMKNFESIYDSKISNWIFSWKEFL